MHLLESVYLSLLLAILIKLVNKTTSILKRAFSFAMLKLKKHSLKVLETLWGKSTLGVVLDQRYMNFYYRSKLCELKQFC